MFTSAFPIISTPDLGRALEFYRELLGGVVIYQFPSGGAPAYVSLRIGTSEIGLSEEPGAGGGSGRQPGDHRRRWTGAGR